MGQASDGVVTATGVMVWPGWVGVMNWFMMISTSGSCQVGQVSPHTNRAVESADNFKVDDTGGGTAAAVTTSAATPMDIVTRVALRRTFPTPSATASAPTRPMYFAVPIIRPPSLSRRNGGHRFRCRASRWKSSLACGGRNSVVHHCNLARFWRGIT
jgi:hypothetical protein